MPRGHPDTVKDNLFYFVGQNKRNGIEKPNFENHLCLSPLPPPAMPKNYSHKFSHKNLPQFIFHLVNKEKER